MKHNVKTTEIFLTPAISDYLEKKLQKLDKFVNPQNLEESICYVEIGKDTRHHKKGEHFIAELTVHVGGQSFRASIDAEDLYAAIDMAVDEMVEELRSFKDKKSSLVKRSGSKIKAFIQKFYS